MNELLAWLQQLGAWLLALALPYKAAIALVLGFFALMYVLEHGDDEDEDGDA